MLTLPVTSSTSLLEAISAYLPPHRQLYFGRQRGSPPTNHRAATLIANFE
jgi:hypothetical protein